MMTQTELAQLSREELIAMIIAQAEQMVKLTVVLQQLQADYEALKLKFERKRKPPLTSRNSSQPPSRDQKGSLPAQRHRRRRGPPVGHAKSVRQWVAEPDQVVVLHAQACRNCAADLKGEAGRLVRVNPVTELPEASAQVIEVRQYETTCSQCGQRQVAQPSAGLEKECAFGSRLEATVVYYRQEQYLSYQRTQRALWDLHAVEISQGGIDDILRCAGQCALRQKDAL